MKIENEIVEVGQIVFFPKQTSVGAKYKAATVIEINPVGAVKLEIVTNPKLGKIKREWFDVKKLRRSEPPKEEVKS